MKKIKLTAEQAKSIYEQTMDAGVKELLVANFGEELFRKRPIGVWCLTDDGRAIAPEQWSGNNKCIGIGVVSECTEYIVSLRPSVALPLGDSSVKDYDDIVYDTETYDNDGVTDAFIKAQADKAQSVLYMYGDKKFPYKGCPAIKRVREDNTCGLKWSLPTLATLKDMQSIIAELNNALNIVGGYIIPATYHRCATVKKSERDCAFVVDMSSGYVYDRDISYDYYVRSVSAFHLENFKF